MQRSRDVLFLPVRAGEPLRAFLTRSADFADVIPCSVSMCPLDHLAYFDGPLVPTATAVPDITIYGAECPVGRTAVAGWAERMRSFDHDMLS